MLIRILILGVALFGIVNHCKAHFLWLDSGGGQALVFFGENESERDYRMPERLDDMRLHHRTADNRAPIGLQQFDGDDFVGKMSNQSLSPAGVIETTCQYGVYRGSLLTYYAKHYFSADSAEWQRLGRSRHQRLDVVPERQDGKVIVRVFWEGKPVKGASVSLSRHDDVSQGKRTTDDEGTVVFEDVPDGLVGFIVGFTKKNSRGVIGEDAYESEIHYATVTFRSRENERSEVTSRRAKRRPSAAPEGLDLPFAVASFGAAVSDNHLYVYGGHVGKAHAHSRANLSNRFARRSFDPDSKWEDLPFETPVQGLALVAHQGMIYRVGGMTAKNASEEDDDLHSTTDFSQFDPQSKTWTQLSPLPTARSSHDAVVIDDKLYVVGGWNLTGSDEGQWQAHSLVMDLSAVGQGWRQLPEQPFERRALAVGRLRGKIVVVGGIDSLGEVSRDVDLFDPETSQWSKANAYPGEGMNGFGVSAWNLGGQLYVSGSNGVVYRLDRPKGNWQSVGQLKQPRFFHRLVSNRDDVLIAIGGASSIGHLDSIEHFVPAR